MNSYSPLPCIPHSALFPHTHASSYQPSPHFSSKAAKREPGVQHRSGSRVVSQASHPHTPKCCSRLSKRRMCGEHCRAAYPPPPPRSRQKVPGRLRAHKDLPPLFIIPRFPQAVGGDERGAANTSPPPPPPPFLEFFQPGICPASRSRW